MKAPGADGLSGLRCSILYYEVSSPDGEPVTAATELNIFVRGSARLERLRDIAQEGPVDAWRKHLHQWTLDESDVQGVKH